jgi:hypothetical protein
MSAARNLNDLSPDVRTEIELLALRVTQGFPAFRSLKSVLTEGEWRQIESELEGYFPSPKRDKGKGATVLKTGKSAQVAVTSTPEAASPASEPAAPTPRRPQYYAIKTLMRLRKMSQCRAILELALATDLLTDAGYRRLLREIGEGEPKPAPTKRPVWDARAGTLRFEKTLLRTIRSLKRAKNLVAILNAFESHAWVPRVPNPLGTGQQVHDAVLALDRSQRKVVFHVEGDGEWISWARR